MPDYDAIVIGAGHNGLVCAGYLVRAGYRVLVLERRHIVGGAVVTEEIVPGFKFDLGGSAHILIHHTPIVADLGLESYGLEYIDVDPLFFAPFPDGSHITIWKDVEKTCESIARVSSEDAENYRRFVHSWGEMARGMVESFIHPPTAGSLMRHLVLGSGLGFRNWEKLTDILHSYGQVVQETFRTPQLQALVAWMAAQSGPPPTEPLSAPFALWHPMYHHSGLKRPRGGSGMLTKALAAMVEANGGEVRVSTPVKRLLLTDGTVRGVETEEGERITARVVVSATHIATTRRFVSDMDLPYQAKTLLDKTRIGNGFGMVVRCAVRELPRYTALPSDGEVGPQHRALQFICPSMDYLNRAYGDYLGGRPSQDPALIAMTFSAVDGSLAPAGNHTLFVWAQYYPYRLASGERWDDIGDREADRILEVLSRYAPNVQDAVIDRLVETPAYLERELGLYNGNVMHLEMSTDQMFMLRPALTLGKYKGLLPGLYLTGASTHPGGGIMGASGYNAAKVVLKEIGRRR